MHHEGFLQAIREQPHDGTPKLVYADWLDEFVSRYHGPFVRLGVAVLASRDEELALWPLVQAVQQARKHIDDAWADALFPRCDLVVAEGEPFWRVRCEVVGLSLAALSHKRTVCSRLYPRKPRPVLEVLRDEEYPVTLAQDLLPQDAAYWRYQLFHRAKCMRSWNLAHAAKAWITDRESAGAGRGHTTERPKGGIT
jgi:uncharacterized protein (TIGR02996 family)